MIENVYINKRLTNMMIMFTETSLTYSLAGNRKIEDSVIILHIHYIQPPCQPDRDQAVTGSSNIMGLAGPGEAGSAQIIFAPPVTATELPCPLWELARFYHSIRHSELLGWKIEKYCSLLLETPQYILSISLEEAPDPQPNQSFCHVSDPTQLLAA